MTSFIDKIEVIGIGFSKAETEQIKEVIIEKIKEEESK